MADDLMIEVTGSVQKADTALDRIIKKIDDLRAHFDKAAPSASKFAAQMDKIAASSKAFSAFQKLTEGTNRQALSAKNAESRMAMYQARLDRANVSMERSRVQSEKLATSLGKVSALQNIAEHNNSAFSMPESEFARRFNSNSGDRGINLTPDIPTDTFEPTPAPGTARLASEMPQFSKASINIDTTRARFAVQQLGAFIDNLNPTVSRMSTEAQAKFNALAERLMHVGQEIDNQRALYHNLATESGRVASAAGEGSAAYLRLEKRMLSATGAIDRLVTKQDKLKAQMSDIAAEGERAGFGLLRFGSNAEKSSSQATSGFQKTLRMMESMMIRIAAFRIFSAISQGVVTGINNMVLANSAANQTMSALSTNALYLKNSLAASLMPVLQSLVPVLNQVTDALANVFNTIGMLTARIFNHASTVTIARKAGVDYAATLDKTKSSADAAKKSLMGFDELNILQKPSGSTSNANPGMPSPASTFETVKIPDWVEKIGEVTDKIQNLIKTNIDTVTRLLRLAPLVVGAVLAFSGVNVPLGIALMAVGAVEMGKQAKEDWDFLTNKTNSSLDKTKKILQIVGAVELALGAVLAFSGAAVGLGIALMIGGITTTAAALNWDSMGEQVKKSIGAISFASAVAMLALGAILTFSGANVPLGIGLLIGGATTLAASKSLNWNTMDPQIKQAISKISFATGGAMLVLGAILTLTGANVPLGVGLLIGGATTIASAVALNWDSLKGPIKTALSSILAIVSASAVAVGILLCLTGAGLPIGIGLILAGMKGVSAANSISTNPVTKWAKDLMNGVIGVFESGINWIISMIDKVSWTVPDWVLGIGGQTYGINISPVHIPRLATGGLLTDPTLMLGGEGADHEAVLPLNDNVYSDIGKGIQRNTDSESDADILERMDRISDRLQSLERAILDRPITIYADDRKIAESSNRGNKLIGRTAPTA